MMMRILIYTLLLVNLGVQAFAVGPVKASRKYSDSTFVFKADDPIAANLDSLNYLKLFELTASASDIAKLNIYHYQPDEIPTFDDLVYEARMAKLDAASPIALDYHASVRPYIEMYTMRKRTSVARMLGLSKMYFPIFEAMLDKYNLPLELKNLAIIESALNANAVSRCGATGLWQFMYGTGKMFDLNVTSYVDERKDPYKETEAACKYFKYLYKMFGDWQLVLAAYNGGPGTVNKAIRRSGGKKTYWEIRPYLPVETQGYVPAFIAANYVMNYTSEHNLYPTMPKLSFFQVDTVKTTQQVSFYQLSAVLDIPMEDLVYLNPSYKKHVIPFDSEGMTLVLPVNKIGDFINNEMGIYAYKTPQEKMMEMQAELAKSIVYKEVGKIHKVRKGETVATVARKYGCSASELKEWNHLKTGKLKSGQRLTVYTRVAVNVNYADKGTPTEKDKALEAKIDSTYANCAPAPADETIVAPPATQNIKHKVRSGESLGSISKKYNCSVADLKEWNNLKKETVLKGQIITIKKEKPNVTASADTTKDSDVVTKVEETEKTNGDKTKITYYTVQHGDTLWSIANRKGISVSELKQWNKSTIAKGLKTGTKLKIVVAG